MHESEIALTTRLLELQPGLRSSVQLVFFVLRDLMGHRRSFVYAGHHAMSRVLGLNRHTVRQALPTLREAGLLAYEGEAVEGTEMRWVMPGALPELSESALAVAEYDHSRRARREARQTAEAEAKRQRQVKKAKRQQRKVAERRERERKALSKVPKPMSLTEDQKAMICGNTLDALERMTEYLRFGGSAVGAADPASGKCQSTDWRRFQEGENPHIEKWNEPMFAGYFWWLASWYKVTQLTPPRQLTLPHMPRLIGDCKNLMKTRTRHQTHQYVRDVISHWSLICWMCGRAGQTLQLDSNTLSNPMVSDRVTAIQNHGELWVQEQYAQFQAVRAAQG